MLLPGGTEVAPFGQVRDESEGVDPKSMSRLPTAWSNYALGKVYRTTAVLLPAFPTIELRSSPVWESREGNSFSP